MNRLIKLIKRYIPLTILYTINGISLSIAIYFLIIDFQLFRIIMLCAVCLIAIITIRSEYITLKKERKTNDLY